MREKHSLHFTLQLAKNSVVEYFNVSTCYKASKLCSVHTYLNCWSWLENNVGDVSVTFKLSSVLAGKLFIARLLTSIILTFTAR